MRPSGKRCQFCMSIMDERASVCPKCSREQVAAAPPMPVAKPATPPDPKIAKDAERQRVREKIAADEAEKARRLREKGLG